MMELKSIDLMFSDQNLKPMPIKESREYMKECKKAAKDKAKIGKRKYPLDLLFPSVNAEIIVKCNNPFYSSVVPNWICGIHFGNNN